MNVGPDSSSFDTSLDIIAIGADSNLTREISHLTNITVVSARSILEGAFLTTRKRRFALIINAFQPAVSRHEVWNPVSYLDMSLSVLARVLQDVDIRSCGRVIYTSSAAVYGNNANCVETDPMHVGSLYGAMKIAAEELVRSFGEQRGVEYTIVRPFNLFGGSDKFSALYHLERAVRSQESFTLINDGTSTRDYVHVADAAKAYLAFLQGRNPGTVNIGRGQPISVRELIDVLLHAGHNVFIESARRSEVSTCIANTDRLVEYVDISNFIDPKEYLLNTLTSATRQ